jgi:hypothetical protein
MTPAELLAQQILARARSIAARKSAERDEAAAADTTLPLEHARLRRMLLDIAARGDRKDA